jgi:hypothetical protein
VNRFLRKEQFSSSEFRSLVKAHLCDSADSVIIADDSVQDKRYSKFIELVKNSIAAMNNDYQQLHEPFVILLSNKKASIFGGFFVAK